MALRVSRTARRRYGLDELVPAGGHLSAPGLPALRRVAERINQARAFDETARRVSGGELLAVSGLEERLVAELSSPAGGDADRTWGEALARLTARLGSERVEALLATHAAEFEELGTQAPAVARFRDLVTLWLLERNAAAGEVAALLHEGIPRPGDAWLAVERVVGRERVRHLTGAPLGTEGGGSLLEQLRTLGAAPTSTATLLSAADALVEEQRPAFVADPGPPNEPERAPAWQPLCNPSAQYTPEAPWMADVVLVAKQVHVWLDQLSQSAGRTLSRLDEIPDAELARLAGWGFNTLWLVGVWERSRASRWIKQLGGNPEAAASAYAVAEYEVADDLGGRLALTTLRDRAARHGLRLAADMVPNHMGIDSRWVLEHPERFLTLDEPPFPNYSFRGPDLSPSPGVGLYLEDHYYDRSDAAVVFERVDRRTGERLYVYHGNDGTGLPWNDTAQLDYRRAEVREAVLETILGIVRQFPVVRFDAAMTLAQRHYQRLWFPPPGSGGAIPSRAGHGVGPEEFQRLMPSEFWRQVVDRVRAEVPGALLIAEAFWLMEEYFARDLGLHRVYNSAFLNHLRGRDPGALRRHLTKVLGLDARLLAHHVNYLSNPDEAPAREVFDSDERYLGACTLLSTLPGLPMFAHGQVEGLRERYGMEYRRAYREEASDGGLVEAHERRIAPLLARRALFAGVDDFRLFELRSHGGPPEAALVFANGRGGDLHLVACNLGAAPTRGVVEQSVPFRPDAGAALRTSRLLDAVSPRDAESVALEALDSVSGERLRWSVATLGRGLALDLGPWQTRVLVDFGWSGPGTPSAESVPVGWWGRLVAWLVRFWVRLRRRS